MKIIALDIATKCGIAILEESTITTYYIEGNPVFQFQTIQPLLINVSAVLVEDFSYYNYCNPVTTAKLNQRIGYLIHRLEEDKVNIIRYNVNTVRKFLELKDKKTGRQKKELNQQLKHITGCKLTTDESDAIALLLFHTKTKLSELTFSVEKKKRISNV